MKKYLPSLLYLLLFIVTDLQGVPCMNGTLGEALWPNDAGWDRMQCRHGESVQPSFPSTSTMEGAIILPLHKSNRKPVQYATDRSYILSSSVCAPHLIMMPCVNAVLKGDKHGTVVKVFRRSWPSKITPRALMIHVGGHKRTRTA